MVSLANDFTSRGELRFFDHEAWGGGPARGNISDRAFIEKSETKYHYDNTSVQEEIRGGMQITSPDQRRFTVRYTLFSTTVSRVACELAPVSPIRAD